MNLSQLIQHCRHTLVCTSLWEDRFELCLQVPQEDRPMVHGRNDAGDPDESRYAPRPHTISHNLTRTLNSLRSAWEAWTRWTRETAEKKYASAAATSFHSQWSYIIYLRRWAKWADTRTLFINLRRVFGQLGSRIQSWKKQCAREENQLSRRNYVVEIFDFNGDLNSELTLLSCKLHSGVFRWLRIKTVQADSRSRSKFDEWLAKQSLGPSPSQSKAKKSKEKTDVMNARLREKIQKAASRTRLSPKKTQKTKLMSEVTRPRQDSQAKCSSTEEDLDAAGAGGDAPAPNEAGINDEGGLFEATAGAPSEDSKQTDYVEDIDYKTKFLALLRESKGRALTQQEQADIKSDAARAAEAAAELAAQEEEPRRDRQLEIDRLRQELEDALGAQAASPRRSSPRNEAQAAVDKEEMDRQQIEQLTLLELARQEEELAAEPQRQESTGAEDIWARLKIAQDNGAGAKKLQDAAREAPQVCAGVERLIQESTASNSEAKFDALVQELATMQDKVHKLEQLREEAAAPQSAVTVSTEDRVRMEFNRKVDEHVTAIEEKCRMNALVRSRCINAMCHFTKQPGAKHCRCGAPTSHLDLKCHKCHKRQMGSVADCLSQPECLGCFARNRTAMTKQERAKDMQKDAAAGIDEAPTLPEPELFKNMKNKSKVKDWIPNVTDNAVTMLTRLSNDASNLMMGLNSANIAVMIDDIQDCKVNAKSILGEEPDFNLDARTLLAVIEGLQAFADLSYTGRCKVSSTEVTCKSTAYDAPETFQISAESLTQQPAQFDKDSPEAAMRLKQLWTNLTKLIKKILGTAIAKEHQDMCNQLLAAYEAEEKPQAQFTVSNIMAMHRCAIGWWRAAMEAYIRKSPMLEANFGEDLLWSSIGTSAERPMLHVRSMVNGEGRWAQFIDRHFFQKARQKLKMHANNASSNGIWVGKSKPSQLADKVNLKEFAKRNKGRAEGRQTALWPVKDSQWQRLEFTSLVCPVCLVVSDVSEQQYGDEAAQVICKCEGKGHQHRARDLKGVTIWDALCLEKALKCKSSQDRAQSYRNACIDVHKPQVLEGDFVPPKPLPSAAPVESSARAPSKPPVGASPKAAIGAPAEAPSAAAAKAPSKQPRAASSQKQSSSASRSRSRSQSSKSSSQSISSPSQSSSSNARAKPKQKSTQQPRRQQACTGPTQQPRQQPKKQSQQYPPSSTEE